MHEIREERMAPRPGIMRVMEPVNKIVITPIAERKDGQRAKRNKVNCTLTTKVQRCRA